MDNNPQLLERLLQSVDTTVGTVGGVANNAVGAAGSIAGGALRTGSVLDPAAMRLTPLTQSTTNSAGQTVRQFRDGAGTVLEVVVGPSGPGGELTPSALTSYDASAPLHVSFGTLA